MSKVYSVKVNKYATLFGGAMNITDSPEYKDTVKIGALLAERGYIVKNGGYGGMMEAVSKGASEAGGKVIGYTCAAFGDHPGNEYLSAEIQRKDIYDRLRSLITGTELFIVQRGGVGTLSELFLVLDVIRKMDNKPKVILVGMFWLELMAVVEPMMRRKEAKSITVVADYEALVPIIEALQ